MVNEALTGLKGLCDDICQAEFQDKLRSQSFSELTELFDQYFSYLKHDNGKLSQFWVSCVVGILLALLRVS